MEINNPKRFAIIGAGPSCLFMYKRLVESGMANIEITIFEREETPGEGMPYSEQGACEEHITNVSDNEIPQIVSSISEWIKTAPRPLLERFDIVPDKFNEYKVLPRLLFGRYLADQFALLQKQAKRLGYQTKLVLKTNVVDIIDSSKEKTVSVQTENGSFEFDCIVICTGHNFPNENEGKIPNYFDSPYPPSKLAFQTNYPVGIRGASLTAIDAVRTLARQNGSFYEMADGSLGYKLSAGQDNFRLVLHSLDGLLPAIRFHLEDSHLGKNTAISEETLCAIKAANDGFVPLDYLFETKFKAPILQNDPDFYEKIKDLNLEGFVDKMMALRDRLDAFQLFKAEYAEAAQSIKRRESVYWKEMLAVLSFDMNYPAKHFSAEDMIRLKTVLMPLISIVIAFVPQSSCRELLALYDAGVLSLVAVAANSTVEPSPAGGAIYHYTDEAGDEKDTCYQMFIDAIGQPHLPYEAFPFKGLLEQGTLAPARLRFKSKTAAETELKKGNEDVQKDPDGQYYLCVPGIAINDNFQVVDKYGAFNERIFVMAVPYIGGFNPDYSGLDFCEAASQKIIERLQQESLDVEPVSA